MKTEKTDRGFIVVFEAKYASQPEEFTCLICESSVIGNYENAMSTPGSSALWVGQEHHLNREQVKELIERMQYWLDHGRLPYANNLERDTL